MTVAAPSAPDGGTSTILGVRAACAEATCTPPRDDVRYPVDVPAGREATVFAAAPGTGMGPVALVADVRIDPPPGVAPQEAEGMLTLTVSGGP